MKALALIVVLVAGGLARADGDPVEDARRLYVAGRQAYDAGRLDVAAQSFEAAYRLEPRPALLWNLGQTYRRRFLLEQRVELLVAAVSAYRRYVSESPNGENREDALRLLDELTPLVVRLAPDCLGAPAPPPAPPAKTELMIVADRRDATVALDDGPMAPAPLLAEVAAGEHRVHVESPGHFPVDLRVRAVEGRLVTSEARLRPRPALLDVRGPRGALVVVDQQAQGRLPHARLELTAGRHEVAVLQRGHEPFVVAVPIAPGQESALSVSLARTKKRRAVPWLAAGAGASALTAIALGAAWGKAQSDADSLARVLQAGQLTLPQYATYQSDQSRRDQLRVGTIVTLALAVGLGGAAAGFYWLDDPSLPEARPRQ